MNPIESYMTACTLITITASVISIIVNLIGKAKAPVTAQDERIAKLEARMDGAESHLNNDNKRLMQIEEGNRVTQQALLAIMRHDIDGNNMEQLKAAEIDLQEYLINKGG
ncbi:MAG: hypothetical protein LKE64_11985 [Solobacterium sp.]|jgi:hypothetical protein|nr:hypothetical protein [Solobacterium sp.]MCH4047976.1 hypothetical protein [Solobacterium sp.]MCH4075438.1 hypothetical protein [Solobacterium sp.]MCI1314570.1 hypothetical protein [Solobacterium sp.]MCI1346757.1 hypothetical protein [Solobacterium sp.]